MKEEFAIWDAYLTCYLGVNGVWTLDPKFVLRHQDHKAATDQARCNNRWVVVSISPLDDADKLAKQGQKLLAALRRSNEMLRLLRGNRDELVNAYCEENEEAIRDAEKIWGDE